MIESTYKKIDKFLALLDYPVHEATCWEMLRKSKDTEEAIKTSRRVMWLARLRGATNGKFGRCFGAETL